MIFVHIKMCLEGEEAILTTEGGGSTKLKSCSMEFEEMKEATIHYGGEDFAANIHQHDTTLFIWIGEIA